MPVTGGGTGTVTPVTPNVSASTSICISAVPSALCVLFTVSGIAICTRQTFAPLLCMAGVVPLYPRTTVLMLPDPVASIHSLSTTTIQFVLTEPLKFTAVWTVVEIADVSVIPGSKSWPQGEFVGRAAADTAGAT